MAAMRASATVWSAMPPPDRRSAILLSLGYLAIGAIAWWLSPVAGDQTSPIESAGNSMVLLWAAAALLVCLAWVARDWVGAWLILAAVGPLALQPLTLLHGSGPAAALTFLWPMSAIPLALTLAQGRTDRVLALGAATAALIVGFATIAGWRAESAHLSIVRYVAFASIVALPVAVRIRRPAADFTTAQITEQSRLVLAAVAPALAGLVLVTPFAIGVAALLTASLAVVIASWIAVRPLTWVAARASVQRDLAVAVSEAERSRLAADLHDGPLQDVLLLARRLDDTGDTEGAMLARSIGAELRELSGDLRLPMLDDLGVGPSLEWLAGRVRRMTAVDVRVAYASEGRVPPSVELAAFRIAQEAIANAVRHGSPPILVRCHTAAGVLSLSVEDAGQGLARIAEVATGAPTRFGMLNMQQRAEHVGARLEWRQPHAGGTLVALEWRAASS